MAQVLTTEQVTQIIQNTMLVLLAREELMDEWETNLLSLQQQARDGNLEEELLFVTAVLTLLHSPGDALPTGTSYDPSWQALLTGLQTGVFPALNQDETEAMTLDRLLASVAEAVVQVITQIPDQKETILAELREIHSAAIESNVTELMAWIDDVRALLNGTPARELGKQHQGVYAQHWQTIVERL